MGGLSSVTVGDRRRVQLWVVTLGVIAAARSRALSPPDGRRGLQLGQQPRDGKGTNPDTPGGHMTQAHHVAGLSRPIALPVPLPSLPWQMAYYNSYLLHPGASSKPASRLFLPQDAHRNAGLFGGGSRWTGWTGGGGGGGGGVFNPHPILQALDLPNLASPAPGEGGGGGGGGSPSPGPGQGTPPTPGVTGIIINDGPNHPPTSLLPPGGAGTLRSPDHPHPPSPTRGESYPFMWRQSDVWVWPDQVVTGALPSLQLGAPAKAPALQGQGPPSSGQASSGQAPAPSGASPTRTDPGVLKGRGGSLPPSNKRPSLGSPHSVPFTVGAQNHPHGNGGDPWGTRSGNILSAPFTLSSSRQVASRKSRQHVDDVTDLTTVAKRQSGKATAQTASNTVSVTSAPSGDGRPPVLHTTLKDAAHYRSRSAVDSVAHRSLEKQSTAEVDTVVEEITKVDSVFGDRSQA